MTSILAPTEEDIQLLLAANCHVGTKNCESDMEEYVFKRNSSGVFIFNLAKTWEKLMLAARIVVAVENPEDVCVVSARPYGQRAAYKFCQYAGATNVVGSGGRYTPGTFTNYIQKKYLEPRVLICTDPRTDSQPIKEAAYVNVPVIAFCDTDSNLKGVDVAIPINNKGKHSIAVAYWILAREVLRMRALESRKESWDVMVDLFIYRDPEEVEEQARVQAEAAAELEQQELAAQAQVAAPVADVAAVAADAFAAAPAAVTPNVAPVAVAPEWQ